MRLPRLFGGLLLLVVSAAAELLDPAPFAKPCCHEPIETNSIRIRIDFGADLPKRPAIDTRAIAFTAYNGSIQEISRSKTGATLTVRDAECSAPLTGRTVVRVQNGASAFSFAPADLDRGPIYIPDYHAYITLASDRRPFSPDAVARGGRIRERLALEPEQTYERATHDIPALDPVKRAGEPLYLVLAPDSSWQKFALQWGGHVFISKQALAAPAREAARLTWPGDRISWRIGTGEKPGFRPKAADSHVSVLNDSLPVATTRWSADGLEYEQEAFATVLSGPVSPFDPARSEQTPAVLLMRISAKNGSPSERMSHVWLDVNPSNALSLSAGMLTDADGSVRAHVLLPAQTEADIRSSGHALHMSAKVKPGGQWTGYLAIPFIANLSMEERSRLAQLDFPTERNRVAAYWRNLAESSIPFRVPEPRLNSVVRAAIAHIRLSSIKDPATGLIAPRNSAYYPSGAAHRVAAQSHLFDVLGQTQTAARLLPPLNAANSLDRSAALLASAEHYFFSRDAAWLSGAAPAMKQAADELIRKRGGGLLPAEALDGISERRQWFSVNAYASAALTALAQALSDAGDPEAPRYKSEAGAFRADLRAAVSEAVSNAPVVRLRDNTFVPFVPSHPDQRFRDLGGTADSVEEASIRTLLFGPLSLVDAGIFDADEPLAGWILDDWEDNSTMSATLGIKPHGEVDESLWFSRGGIAFAPNLANPIRTYLRRGESRAAIRHFYNNLAATLFPPVNMLSESFPDWGVSRGPLYDASGEALFVNRIRDLLVTENNGDLCLAPGTPERWLQAGHQVAVSNAPSHFGPVTFVLKATEDEVHATVTLPAGGYRNAWIRVRPDGRQITGVSVDGRPWNNWDPANGRIQLPRTAKEMHIRVRLTPAIIDFNDTAGRPS